MNKIQVGNAPSPNLKQVRSKIGSLENAAHKPGGGNIKIETKKLEFKVTPRIEAKNEKYIPKGGEKKVSALLNAIFTNIPSSYSFHPKIFPKSFGSVKRNNFFRLLNSL